MPENKHYTIVSRALEGLEDSAVGRLNHLLDIVDVAVKAGSTEAMALVDRWYRDVRSNAATSRKTIQNDIIAGVAMVATLGSVKAVEAWIDERNVKAKRASYSLQVLNVELHGKKKIEKRASKPGTLDLDKAVKDGVITPAQAKLLKKYIA